MWKDTVIVCIEPIWKLWDYISQDTCISGMLLPINREQTSKIVKDGLLE